MVSSFEPEVLFGDSPVLCRSRRYKEVAKMKSLGVGDEGVARRIVRGLVIRLRSEGCCDVPVMGHSDEGKASAIIRYHRSSERTKVSSKPFVLIGCWRG